MKLTLSVLSRKEEAWHSVCEGDVYCRVQRACLWNCGWWKQSQRSHHPSEPCPEAPQHQRGSWNPKWDTEVLLRFSASSCAGKNMAVTCDWYSYGSRSSLSDL